MNFLCRLGWHRWRPEWRNAIPNSEFCDQWSIVGHKCTRCGKRRN